MAAPAQLIRQNDGDSHQRSPSWCLAFVRFEEPAAMYGGGDSRAFKEKKLSVIENDCISVSINRPKGSFAKTASMTLKITDINYQYSIAPGDWAFIWMSDFQEDINKIIDALRNINNPAKAKALNDWGSGLKFVGRVLEIPATDNIDFNGVRTLVQQIHCQAHVELASSVYYTFIAQFAINPGQAMPEVVGSELLVKSNLQTLGITTEASKKAEAAQEGNINQVKSVQNSKDITKKKGLGVLGKNIAESVFNYYNNKKEWTPDSMISLMLILLLGIDRDKNMVNQLGARGTFQDAIGIPGGVAKILNRPSAQKLWQTYTMLMGLQKYSGPSGKNKNLFQSFNPEFESEYQSGDNVFYRTKDRCKGFVPFVYSPILDNGTIWSTISQYVNPVVNEMYTALRVNPVGKILPTLVVREQPFSTRLYDQVEGFIQSEMKRVQAKSSELRAQQSKYDKETRGKDMTNGEATGDTKPDIENRPSETNDKTKNIQKEVIEASTAHASQLGRGMPRTMYAELPRWIIDESFISSVNVSISEAKRVNFVQVWGRSKGAEFIGSRMPPEIFKMNQYTNINYAADLNDISRNGLRADITETEFDIIFNNAKQTDGNGKMASLAPVFAKLRADWLFNGHLKPYGTISCLGIKEPICEGDNVLVRGTLYHIDGISFNGSIGQGGKKSFTTTLSVSNGILARSLDSTNPKRMPEYPRSVGSLHYSDERNGYEMPGITDMQNTSLSKGYDNDGEEYHYPRKNDEDEE